MRHSCFDALHPGSQGLGAQTIRQFSEFGSGWQGSLVEKVFGSDMSQAAYEEYKEYHHRQTARARDSISKMMQRKAASMYGGGIHTRGKFPGMQDHGMSAGIREQHTEFKKDFASRWDPMRKIAADIFGEGSDSFSKLRQLPEFQSALQTGLKGEKKLLGSGLTADSFLHKAQFKYSGKTYDFEFVSKKAKSAEDIFLSEGGLMSEQEANNLRQMTLSEFFPKEKIALRQLEDVENSLSPSLYGRAEDSILMEKFNVIEGFKQKQMTKEEYEFLSQFLKEAHDKNITHTDLHSSNLVRVKTETGEIEAAVLDWGLSNRFENEFAISRRKREIIEEMSEKSIGRKVSMQEYAKMADKKRIEAYYKGETSREHHLGINAILGRNKVDMEEAVNEVLKSTGGSDVLTKKNSDSASLIRQNSLLSKTAKEIPNVELNKLSTTTVIKRNEKFRSNSTRAIGIGLRQSSKATTGHCHYNSTGLDF